MELLDGMCVQGPFNMFLWMYIVHMMLRRRMARLLPWLVSRPAMQLMWEKDVPYTQVRAALTSDGRRFVVLLVTVLMALIATLIKFLM